MADLPTPSQRARLPDLLRVSFSGAVTGGAGPRVVALFAALLGANLLAWCWALLAFGRSPALLGSALIAWGFGLRHAVDADHIAAIDNSGQVEGQITKLKLVKRQMYGRAKFDLLEARLVPAP